jgi:anti-anti-sigma regulatory factor
MDADVTRGKVVVLSASAAPRENVRSMARRGPLTRHLVGSLEQEIRNSGPGISRFVIDLRGVAYGDDAGLEALAQLYQAMKAEGRKLDWQCSDSRIESQLRRCGWLTVFQGYGEYL